jgi:hypothetical protein
MKELWARYSFLVWATLYALASFGFHRLGESWLSGFCLGWTILGVYAWASNTTLRYEKERAERWKDSYMDAVRADR